MTVSEALRGNCNVDGLSAEEFKSLTQSYNARERGAARYSSKPISGKPYVFGENLVIFSTIATTITKA